MAALSSLPKQIAQILRADYYAYKHLNCADMAEPNLSRGERKATEELKKNRNAVIITDRDQ